MHGRVPPLTFQPSLLDAGTAVGPSIDPTFDRMSRRFLTDGAWIDTLPGWVRGADGLFDVVLSAGRWQGHQRRMYDRVVDEPRLTTTLKTSRPPVVEEMVAALTARYGLDLSAVTANLYRDGRDSVAWHGDRLGAKRPRTVVAIVVLGAPRPFLLRPNGGGSSVRLEPGHGDLLVMGGTCQQTWEHSVPKRASAGARISVMFREPGVY